MDSSEILDGCGMLVRCVGSLVIILALILAMAYVGNMIGQDRCAARCAPLAGHGLGDSCMCWREPVKPERP